jgi:CheY-like chemotaxis protein
LRIEVWLGQDTFRLPDTMIGRSQKKSKDSIRTVLVVDDERLIADTVTEILTQHGFAAFKAYSGEEAVRLSQVLKPDIVLSDVLMPQMTGIQMAILIREALPTTQIVLFSGQATTAELLRQAAAAGHRFELLAKPIHPEELVRKIKELP